MDADESILSTSQAGGNSRHDLFISPLPFGIPQLDGLLGYEELPAKGATQEGSPGMLDCFEKTNSLALVGRDGTGKSVFAFHLASTYHALHFYAGQKELLRPGLRRPPLVVYVSSDLRWPAAEKIWQNFYLDYPWDRYVPFISPGELDFRRQRVRTRDYFHVQLAEHSPSGRLRTSESFHLEKFLDHASNQSALSRQVCFIDLASETTGDDWLFVARFLASIPRLPDAPPNLLIVDSVAGFETLVGERNSYGDEMTRRARIAQIIRAAGDRWHTVLVVEEPDPGKHNPEEYVTDTVIHLRRESKAELSRRTLEIEKSRARSVGIGEHPFEIRDGRGTSTRSWENPDDPYALLHPHVFSHELKARLLHRNRFNAHIQVFPSLHFLSKEFARSARIVRMFDRREEVVPFGVTYLDNMLKRQRPSAPQTTRHATELVPDGITSRVDSKPTGSPLSSEKEGLPKGSVTSLIGDEGTLKSSLAEQFLVEAFREFPEILKMVLLIVKDFRTGALSSLASYISHRAVSFIDQQAGPARSIPGSVRGLFKLRFSEEEHGGWLHSFPERKDELDKLAIGRWHLKNRRELLIAIDESGSGPLKTRWDANLHYTQIEDQPPDSESDLVLAFSILRMSSGLLTPVVLVSTHDTSAEKIGELIFAKHAENIIAVLREFNIGIPQNDVLEDALKRLLERFILVRRVELVDATAPQLWQIIQSSSIHALYLIGHTLKKVHAAVDPVPLAGDIRVVISDLRLIRDTYPEVAKDPLFLPTLVFRLRRTGFTSLIVDSDVGRPGLVPTHTMNGALRSLVDHQIYTWKVSFFGEQRNAISVIPPLTSEHAGIVRELRFTHTQTESAASPLDRVIDVDPHFELYMGIEEGKPVAVPLQIVLYGETEAFDQYIDAEKDLLQRMFTAVDNQTPIVDIKKTRDYDGLRDYCHLPSDTRLPYSLVFMVDGYWALRRDASLASQRRYLTTNLAQQSATDRSREDSLRLFRPTLQQNLKWPEDLWAQRRDFFAQRKEPPSAGTKQSYYYRHRFPVDSHDVMDRIPFSWDFGFLLCRKKLWENAENVPLFTARNSRRFRDVGTLWKALLKEDPSIRAETSGSKPSIVPWRDFFEACIVVARTEERRSGEHVPAFDLSVQTAGSLISLILELWLSEIVGDAARLRKLASAKSLDKRLGVELRKFASGWAAEAEKHLRKLSHMTILEKSSLVSIQELLVGVNRGKTLSQAFLAERQISRATRPEQDQPVGDADDRDVEYALLLQRLQGGSVPGGYALQLFKTWLLLIEVLEINTYLNRENAFELVSDHRASPRAASSREWYRTACAAQDTPPHDDYQARIPARLPGFFSLRGGWFLAVAKGSRSTRLAERALDLLSSRRANRTRLQFGLGLPTRDIMEGATTETIRTALKVRSSDGEFPVTYGRLLRLGPQTEESPEKFNWLFRSAFRDYDRQTPVLRKSINRLLGWSVRYRHAHRISWRGDFHSYDEIDSARLATVTQYDSWLEFPAFIEALVEELNSATPAGDQ